MENIELVGNVVYLRAMTRDDAQGILEICNDARIFEHTTYDLKTVEDVHKFIDAALKNKQARTEYPFVIIHRDTNKIIGSTRFLEISKEHKRIEIGSTWLHPTYWSTAVNTECKYLLLSYCFEYQNYQRVQIKTGHENIQSQKAIERIGAKKEGILRNHMIRPNGKIRHTVMYSIIEEEWLEVKSHIEGLMDKYTLK